MTRVAIIPARGGSKRIPRKNIRDFLGRPMIAWPIGVARESGLFDRVIVTTDDAEIAGVARAWGAEVPFPRDPALADDHAGLTEVMRDTIARLAPPLAADDMVCLIYATAPFLRVGDLAAGLDLLAGGAADFAVSVATFPAPIDRALVLRDGHLGMAASDNLTARSQDLREAYHDAAQFVWGRAAAWAGRRVFVDPTLPVVLPRQRVQDIDTPEDWAFAEDLGRILRGREA